MLVSIIVDMIEMDPEKITKRRSCTRSITTHLTVVITILLTKRTLSTGKFFFKIYHGTVFNLSGCLKSSCNSCGRKSENNSFHIYWMYSSWLTIIRIRRSHQLSLPREKNHNQDSPKSNSWSLSPHHRSQNSCHEESSSDLRTDDNRWV